LTASAGGGGGGGGGVGEEGAPSSIFEEQAEKSLTQNAQMSIETVRERTEYFP